VRVKFRRVRTFEVFKGRTRSGVTSQKLRSEGKDAKVIGQKSLRSLNERLKFSEGESPKFRGPLDLVDQWED
jgi:hypothetical protein